MCSKRAGIFIVIVFLVGSCRQKEEKLFTLLGHDETGINFQNTFFDDGPLNVANYIYFYNGGGVAAGDVNGDGLPDLLFTGNMVRNRLFINKGNFEFEDVTNNSGVAEKQGWCTGATMADVNGDGRLDIYICRSADIRPQLRTNLLFINEGNGAFTESGIKYGLADTGYSTQAAFFDYDKDGDLDCFIINHSIQKYTAGVQENPALRKEYDAAYACKLYRNDDSKFTDVSKEAGITSSVLTFGLGVAISDLDNDGWPDVYVSNDFNEPDYLFHNNRDGTFTEQLSASMDEVSLFSMGSDAADYNNDGYTDLLTLDMLPEDNKTMKMHSGAENFNKFQHLFERGFYYQYSRNMLQQNNGDGTFSEVGQLAGVSNTDWSWSGLFADYDNDGYKDLFVTNGYLKDYTDMDFMKYSIDRLIKSMNKENFDPVPEYIKKMPTNAVPNYIFKNNGGKSFTKKVNEWGFDQAGISAGAAFADLNNDGALDLVVNNSNDFATVYRNNAQSITKNHFLKVLFQGPASNTFGIGAKVKLYCDDELYYQEQFPVRGFQSTSEQEMTFGIGTHTTIDSLLVVWPDDYVEKISDVRADQTVTLTRKNAVAKFIYDTTARRSNTLLSASILTGVVHRENNFSDFTVQSLLPHYLSRGGPCVEVADVNNDGLEDFFFGAARGFASQIFLQQKSGNFAAKQQPVIAADANSEDVAALFFDANNDGAEDLYVASGGYEYSENDPNLQDRLYINDGKGNFRRDQGALPTMMISSSCVKAADIDADGDLDLFIGGRVIPGKYPLSPGSVILLNDGHGVFQNATNALCPELEKIGMVTDAVWLDVNKDQHPDLVVVGEWMPVKVFINDGKTLFDESAAYIHFASSGWWNTIAAADADADGDTDLVIGNCGLNTQFQVSEKQPMTIYYKDFDDNGTIDPIVCYYIQDTAYPIYSKDDLADQLPGIRKKFLQYKPYATAKMSDIFSEDQLRDAPVLKAEMMQTVYLENSGKEGFTLHTLPQAAEVAPVYGIVATDLNSDGKLDFLMSGNNTWTRIKFGRYSANHGVVLLGNGKGEFRYTSQYESGLHLRGDVRSLKEIVVRGKSNIIVGKNDAPAEIIQKNFPR